MSPSAEKVRKALKRLEGQGITITLRKNPLATLWNYCRIIRELLNCDDLVPPISEDDLDAYLAESDKPEEDVPAYLPPGDPPRDDDDGVVVHS